MKPSRSIPLALALACNGATPPPAPDAPPATCAERARTLAWANEALALRSDELALARLTNVLACEDLSDPHRGIAEAGRALLAATGPEARRLRAYIKARKDSPAALQVALARLRALPEAEGRGETLALCESLSDQPALRVSCYEAVPALTEAEVGGALRAYGALAALSAADLERIVQLGTGGATGPLRACMARREPLVRPGDRATLGALAFKLSEVAEPVPAACLRRLAFEHCRDALLAGHACPAPESIAPAIRDAARNVDAFVALHRREGALGPAIDVTGWENCEGPGPVDAEQRAALRMMHIAEAEALAPELQRGLRVAASEAREDLFNRVRHVDCARTLWCGDTQCDSAGFADYFTFSVADGECPRSCGSDIRGPIHNAVPDRDGDGVPDGRDKCPDAAETRNDHEDDDGCPDVVPSAPDRDGDGVPDSRDKCPDAAETRNDHEDDDGCPDVVPPPPDRDGDGIADELDRCPDYAETSNLAGCREGCPSTSADRDGDGIFDPVDECPRDCETDNRIRDADGCPDSPNDHDGDRVPNNTDQCPNTRETFNRIMDADGCPDSTKDHDGDGVPNSRDACPTRRETGLITNLSDGCPDLNHCRVPPGVRPPIGCP